MAGASNVIIVKVALGRTVRTLHAGNTIVHAGGDAAKKPKHLVVWIGGAALHLIFIRVHDPVAQIRLILQLLGQFVVARVWNAGQISASRSKIQLNGGRAPVWLGSLPIPMLSPPLRNGTFGNIFVSHHKYSTLSIIFARGAQRLDFIAALGDQLS